jgi:hypothetical protein
MRYTAIALIKEASEAMPYLWFMASVKSVLNVLNHLSLCHFKSKTNMYKKISQSITPTFCIITLNATLLIISVT